VKARSRGLMAILLDYGACVVHANNYPTKTES
jgi:hypothetical protein